MQSIMRGSLTDKENPSRQEAAGPRTSQTMVVCSQWRWLAPSSMAPIPPARSHPGTKATTTPPQSSCTQIPRGTAQSPTVIAHKGCAGPPLLPELLVPPAKAKGGDSGMR